MVGGFDGVGPAQGCAPGQGPVGVAVDVPAGVGLVQVVVLAARPEVAGAGRAVRERDVVVELAAIRGLRARGGPAGAVPGDHIVLEHLRWPVDGGAVVEQVPSHRIHHEPGPRRVRRQRPGHGGGQGAVADQLGRVIPQPEQRGQVDDDLDGDLPAVRLRQVRALQRTPGQSHQGIRPPRVDPPPCPSTSSSPACRRLRCLGVAAFGGLGRFGSVGAGSGMRATRSRARYTVWASSAGKIAATVAIPSSPGHSSTRRPLRAFAWASANERVSALATARASRSRSFANVKPGAFGSTWRSTTWAASGVSFFVWNTNSAAALAEIAPVCNAARVSGSTSDRCRA